MRNIDVNLVKEKVKEVFMEIPFCYDSDTKERLIDNLKIANEKEKRIIQLLLENEQCAKKNHVPLCQDTGMAIIYLKIGQDVHFINGSLSEAINQGVREAYQEAYLRYSVVADPLFDRKNTFDNTPALIHYDIVEGQQVQVECMAKGFGSENTSKLFMLTAADGLEGIKKQVIQAVKEKGANACPPLTIGIGIGGSSDTCLWLAKKALLRQQLHHQDERYANLEKELLEQINQLNIGAAGLHGQATCLKVCIESFPTHIAALPVGLNINCHAVRKKAFLL